MNPFLIKCLTFFSKMGIVLLAFFAPILVFIYAIIFLTIVDLITAIIKDIKLKKKSQDYSQYIESRKMRKTITKIIMYILFIISSYVLMKITFGATFFIPNIVFGSLALVEVVSIGENMSIVTGNNVFIRLTKKISKVFTNKIDKTFE